MLPDAAQPPTGGVPGEAAGAAGRTESAKATAATLALIVLAVMNPSRDRAVTRGAARFEIFETLDWFLYSD
jgi:hypothetical protein